MRTVLLGAVMAAGLAQSASAATTLQLDVNAIRIQAQNGLGAPSPFGGLWHTGSVNFSFQSGITAMAGVFVNGANQGFTGTLSDFVGTVVLSNGHVVGGSLAVMVNGGTDSYTCDIVPSNGRVTNYVGGGFTIEGLTFHGAFTDSQFGNVNVAQWAGSSLTGSFLQFNFMPDPNGAGYADMDLFVTAVPIPSVAWAGLGTLAGAMALGYVKRKRG